MKFYKDHYQVIIMGGGLAGMSCALQLQAWGIKDILILEKHNMPGGLATDFVRNGFEIEATLHEMMSIGTKEEPLKVGKFFDEMGVDIDWLHVPECYRAVLPNSGLDVTLHEGYETMAREIDAAVPGTFEKVHELMLLCRRVYDSMNILSVTPMSKVQMLLKHPDFVKTVGYSATEVINTFGLPKKAVELLTPYWIYVGNRMDDLPFTIYAFLMADYFTGSYVCRGYSHEMSMKLQRKVEENGAQFEFRQEVTKILVRRRDPRGLCRLGCLPQQGLLPDDRTAQRGAARGDQVRQRPDPQPHAGLRHRRARGHAGGKRAAELFHVLRHHDGHQRDLEELRQPHRAL